MDVGDDFANFFVEVLFYLEDFETAGGAEVGFAEFGEGEVCGGEGGVREGEELEVYFVFLVAAGGEIGGGGVGGKRCWFFGAGVSGEVFF